MIFLDYSLVIYLTFHRFNLFYGGRFVGLILAENILTVESLLQLRYWCPCITLIVLILHSLYYITFIVLY